MNKDKIIGYGTLIIMFIIIILMAMFISSMGNKLFNNYNKVNYLSNVSFCQGISINALTRYMDNPNLNQSYEEIRIDRDNYAYKIYHKCMEDIK